jgi:hypothetical protein
MENVAQLVELQFVVLAVAGSIPVVLPKKYQQTKIQEIDLSFLFCKDMGDLSLNL